MRTYELAVGATGTGMQPPLLIDPSSIGRDKAMLQIEFSAAGSVTVEARIDPSMSWLQVAGPYTEDEIDTIQFVPQMQLNIASNTGTITAKVLVS